MRSRTEQFLARRPRILKIEEREVIAKGEATPQTVGELAADRPSQQAHREMVDRQHALERRHQVLTSEFNSYSNSRDRAYQLQLSRELDQIEAELAVLRRNLTTTGERVAKTDLLSQLNAKLHEPTLRKSDLPDPFELSNGLGLRTQPRIEE